MLTDPHSFSIPAQVRVTHLRWTAAVDFASKTIKATATWEIKATSGEDRIILDTKGLSISKVTIGENKTTEFQLSEPDSLLGQALTIMIDPDTKVVNIEYQTTPGAEALQWLQPSQTAGKKEPFLFTQSQAILARSWIPCQDSPGVRFTYEAEVTVPPNLLALMSATNPQRLNPDGKYRFEMQQPISSYLLALSVGDIHFKPISSRSGIYAEPAMLDTAAWELADLEKMISGAEELYGDYAWERYDVLILPPSFPFGGMENPRITFATPTILAGDRSLTSLIAHELAHSWSGNLVTNATWDDFWLNEGFTVYFEHRIMEKLYGQDFAEMQASLALQDLEETISSMQASGNAADTKLRLNLKGRNPDEGVTDIGYNKGYFFLRSIEEKFGRDKFDAFLRDYFSSHAFTSMNTEGFIKSIKEFYSSTYKITHDDQTFNAWIFTEGLPVEHPRPHSEKLGQVDAFITQWKKSGKYSTQLATNWSTQEWLHFLKNLPDTLSQEQLTALDKFGKFTKSGNAEIVTVWLVIAIRNNYTSAFDRLEEFLIHTGRRKFLSPLYNELLKTADGRERAVAIYQKARPNYHFVATNTFDPLMHKQVK
jgi:leukotriene A-4 hydrolase/aminopeptidase